MQSGHTEIALAGARMMQLGTTQSVVLACQPGSEATLRARILNIVGPQYCDVELDPNPRQSGTVIARISPKGRAPRRAGASRPLRA